MTVRRKIAGWLRGLARAVDDRKTLTRPEVDARIAALLAQPRKVNQYVERAHFQRCELTPLVVAAAEGFERESPGCYDGYDDMVRAIGRLRARGL